MNWTKIKEQYPKAYKILEDNSDYFAALRLGVRGFDKRFLYDFFDEQGIIATVSYCYANIENKFHAEIYTTFECRYGNRWYKHYYKSRTETEEILFEKAFEILEKK